MADMLTNIFYLSVTLLGSAAVVGTIGFIYASMSLVADTVAPRKEKSQ